MVYSVELCHHGIKGQKWGVRRFQNEDGTLTAKGVKRYSTVYGKEMAKYEKDVKAASRQIRIDAYNKTADEYNNGKINEFNKKHKPTDLNYLQEYNRQFENDFAKNYHRSAMEFAKNNKHYKKAEALSKKYSLDKVDDLARKNKEFISAMNDYLEWSNG